MSEPLNKKRCIPCEGNVPPLGADAIKNYLSKLHQGWKSLEDKEIERRFVFINFKAAIAFINEVADIAEFEGHHPNILLYDFNKVVISLSTHAIQGLSENDFILASKIDEIDTSV